MNRQDMVVLQQRNSDLEQEVARLRAAAKPEGKTPTGDEALASAMERVRALERAMAEAEKERDAVLRAHAEVLSSYRRDKEAHNARMTQIVELRAEINVLYRELEAARNVAR